MPVRSVIGHIRREDGDLGRVERWEREGWGNHPSNIERCAGRKGFRRREDFPMGLSQDYLGGIPPPTNHKFAYGSDKLEIGDIERCESLRSKEVELPSPPSKLRLRR